MITRRTFLAAAACLPAARVRAQASFPARPVTIVVPYPAGGSVDLVARALSDPMAQALKQPVIVENRGGGSGVVATQSVAAAEPDGYRIILGTQQTHGTNEALLPNAGYHAAQDFAPICQICTVPHALVVRRDLPVTNAAGLVALLKKEPGRYNYGSTGNGSSSHLAAELFKIRTGVAAQHVPYRGGAPLAQDLMAGVVDFSFVVIANILGQIQSGGVRALAVASPTRAPVLPDVPTLAQTGVADIDADAWFALFAPARTPRDRISALAQTVETALSQEAVRGTLARNAVVMRWRAPAEMPAFVAAEVGKWAEVVRVSGAKADL